MVFMGDIFFIGKHRKFTLDEARGLLPTIRRVTRRAVLNVEDVHQMHTDAPTSQEAELAVQAVISAWSEQISQLGCESKGLWQVDFDNGDGYYCWRYPEETLNYFHLYGDGFSQRLPITK